jgi:exodeoxyribonuclease-3
VEEWLAYAKPDVLCLQETKVSDATFPHLAFAALGYESAHHGDGRWNGVAILSKVGLEDVVPGFAQGLEPDHETRLVTASCAGVTVSSAYVPNGRGLADPQFQYKLGWLAKLGEHVSLLAGRSRPVAVCGDFNIAPGDSDVWDPSAFVESTHTSVEERKALAAIEDRGLVDAFRARYPDSGLYTYWDYRAGDFHEHRGMRIDLVLLSPTLTERMTWALVDRNARKGKLPSDHAPVFVDISDDG